MLAATVCLLAAAALAALPPGVPDNPAHVAAYVQSHGQALAEEFARDRIGDLSRLGRSAADQQAAVAAMAKRSLASIAGETPERQQQYLAGMHDRLAAKKRRSNGGAE